MPNVKTQTAYLSTRRVWVGGWSVANLLALWRLHGYDGRLTAAWRAGVVPRRVSAGSIAGIGGTTDSFGRTCGR